MYTDGIPDNIFLVALQKSQGLQNVRTSIEDMYSSPSRKWKPLRNSMGYSVIQKQILNRKVSIWKPYSNFILLRILGCTVTLFKEESANGRHFVLASYTERGQLGSNHIFEIIRTVLKHSFWSPKSGPDTNWLFPLLLASRFKLCCHPMEVKVSSAFALSDFIQKTV